MGCLCNGNVQCRRWHLQCCQDRLRGTVHRLHAPARGRLQLVRREEGSPFEHSSPVHRLQHALGRRPNGYDLGCILDVCYPLRNGVVLILRLCYWLLPALRSCHPRWHPSLVNICPAAKAGGKLPEGYGNETQVEQPKNAL